jgi:hypothetical protein
MPVPPSIQKFVGTWVYKDTDVQYSITVQEDAISVTGTDLSDGEELRIQDISFDGSELRFTTICPSTVYALRHIFRSPFGDNVEHEFTRIENWYRKKA